MSQIASTYNFPFWDNRNISGKGRIWFTNAAIDERLGDNALIDEVQEIVMPMSCIVAPTQQEPERHFRQERTRQLK